MDQNPPPSSHSTTYTSFPILAISILGILTTAILLLSYYLFITKCCLNWRRSDILLFRLSSFSRSRRQFNPNLAQPPLQESRGLDTSTINSIPTIRFTKITTSSIECAVCLSDFQEQELLKILPNCSHVFHIDCIDTWLQSSANCPMCRAGVNLLQAEQYFKPTEQDSSSVVIEIRDESPLKKPKRFWEMVSMGDECIDVRERDNRFEVNKMRRSFSMDSLNNPELYVWVQEILRKNQGLSREVGNGEGSSSSNGGISGSGSIRRSLFSFGRSSRSASVLPLQNAEDCGS